MVTVPPLVRILINSGVAARAPSSANKLAAGLTAVENPGESEFWIYAGYQLIGELRPDHRFAGALVPPLVDVHLCCRVFECPSPFGSVVAFVHALDRQIAKPIDTLPEDSCSESISYRCLSIAASGSCSSNAVHRGALTIETPTKARATTTVFI